MPGDSTGQSASRSALAHLLEGYVVLIRKAVMRAASRRAAPYQDDIAQVVATAVWRQLERGQTIDQPASYVYKAVVRETVRALRREQGRREVSIDAPEAAVLAGDADTEAAFEGRRLGEVIEACLADLSEDRARAVRGHRGPRRRRHHAVVRLELSARRQPGGARHARPASGAEGARSGAMSTRATRPLSDEAIGAAYRARPGGTEARTHPDEHAWEAFASGTMEHEARLRLADHVVSCESCRDVYDAVRVLMGGARAIDSGAPRGAAPAVAVGWWRLHTSALALAAAAVFVVGAITPPSQTFPNLARDEGAAFFVAQVGTFTRYFAAGATGSFFDTRLALLR